MSGNYTLIIVDDRQYDHIGRKIMAIDEITVRKKMRELSENRKFDPLFLEFHVKKITKQKEFESRIHSEKFPDISATANPVTFNKEIISYKLRTIADKELINELALQQIRLFVEYYPRYSHQGEIVKEAIRDNSLDLLKLVKAYWQKDAEYLRRIFNGQREELPFLLHLMKDIGKPFYRKIASVITLNSDEIKDHSGDCPMCGHKAAMAKLDKETGSRTLWCSLCGTEWPFKRVKCVHCGNEDQKTLQYFYEETGPYRVEVCQLCNKYIKTVDERKKGESETTDMELEDIITVDLDGIAYQEGFRKYNFWEIESIKEE